MRDSQRAKLYAAESPLRHALVDGDAALPHLDTEARVRLLMRAGLPEAQAHVAATSTGAPAHAKSLNTCVALAHLVWAALLPEEPLPTFSRKRTRALRGRHSGGYATYRTNHIAIHECSAGYELATVAHEVAHLVAYKVVGHNRFPPHGAEFRAAHLIVASIMLGRDVAASLSLSYKAAGLRYCDTTLQRLIRRRDAARASRADAKAAAQKVLAQGAASR